jgi:branched-chain amino acid transport system substrate-binding protein
MIVNLTGASAYFGQSDVQAFRAASNQLNKAGGILNRRITIDYVDSQGNPSKAVSLLTDRLNSGTKYDLCECGTFSAETLALLPAMTKAKVAEHAARRRDGLRRPRQLSLNFGYNTS